jgi:ferric-dicitrate binding protein FerR (iron transport regulator)
MYEVSKRLSDLLEKDTWTPEESHWVLTYLESSDGAELQLLMQQQFNENNEQLLPAKRSRRILGEIHKSLHINNRTKKASVIRLWVGRTAVAASIIFIIGFAWQFFADHKKSTATTVSVDKKTDTVEFVVRHEVNTTAKEKRIQLSDGSLIVLAKESEITYQEPFVNSRSVSLIGKAYFKVTHDASRPFVVTSGDLTTTDLGTEFTVTAFRNSHQIVVRLYQGSVVIRPLDKMNRRMTREVYLVPGQEFVYSSQKSAKVNRFKPLNAAPEQILKVEQTSDNPLLPKQVDTPWFMFNNQSLENVLNDLSALYNVEIVYDKKDIENIYFTGKYNKSESLTNILKRIATLNNLTITKKDSAYIISR